MKKEDVSVLKQLVHSLEESAQKMQMAHERKDSEKFNANKKFFIKIQKKIEDMLK